MLEVLDRDWLAEFLSRAARGGKDFAEIFIENGNSLAITCDDNKIERVLRGQDQGVGLRIIRGPEVYYACTNEINSVKLEELLKIIQYNEENQHSAVAFHPSAKPKSTVNIEPDSIDTKTKAEKVLEGNQAARSFDPRVKQVTVRYHENQQQVCIVNSNGDWIEDRRVRTRYVVQVIAAEGSELQTGFEGPGITGGWEFFDRHSAKEIAQTAARRAVLMLNAKPAPTGIQMVVLAGEAGGTIVHEACGHALEADFIHKKTSVFHDQRGNIIASPLVTMVDQGNLPGFFGTHNFDDEGVPTQRNVLIDNGKLVGLMTDRYYAMNLNIPLSGNGRRQSYRNKPQPRMTNTYIDRGKSNPDDIIRSVQDGILVKKMGGGQVNTTTGDFVFEINEGYRLRHGQPCEAIRGATLVGNGAQILKTIDMVGNDLSFIPGVCGKYDHAPVTDGMPTIRIPEIIIGGI